MSTVSRSALVSFSAEQMFDLVVDVPSYPQFLPFCAGAHAQDHGEEVHATVEMSIAGMKKSFTTANTHQRPSRIDLRLVDGPFKSLEGSWGFEALGPDACKVTLELEFEFGSRLLAGAVGPVFEKLSNSMIDAFTERAAVVYGASDAS